MIVVIEIIMPDEKKNLRLKKEQSLFIEMIWNESM